MWQLWLAEIPRLFFTFAFGASVGSFINVLAYRIPKGQGFIRPVSRCTACETPLTWRENIPIFGWLFLRGRCRFCRSRISSEYPEVELLVALLFVSLYTLLFFDGGILRVAGVDADALRPGWAQAPLMLMWPQLALLFAVVGSLVAMTIIDVKTYTIPLVIPWTLAALALLAHPLHALYAQFAEAWPPASAGGHTWTIPTTGGALVGASLGGALGLAASIFLLAKGFLPRSFADYEAWEEGQRAENPGGAAVGHHPTPEPEPAPAPVAPPSGARRGLVLFVAPLVVGAVAGLTIGAQRGAPVFHTLVGLDISLVIVLLLRRLAPPVDEGAVDQTWLAYPHPRREVLKEILFLAPPVAGAVIGFFVASGVSFEPPLWLTALGGSLLGALVGGGVVWGVRILGTLAFGKEAMGLGDVHLMAAVGAALGWIDPVLAFFFLAPFFGLAWTIASALAHSVFKRRGAALPYGPHLALATLLIIYARPAFERLLSLVLQTPIDLP